MINDDYVRCQNCTHSKKIIFEKIGEKILYNKRKIIIQYKNEKKNPEYSKDTLPLKVLIDYHFGFYTNNFFT